MKTSTFLACALALISARLGASMIDEIQVYETRAIDADAMLLICAAIPDADIAQLARVAEPREAAPGQAFVDQGDPARYAAPFHGKGTVEVRMPCRGAQPGLGVCFPCPAQQPGP